MTYSELEDESRSETDSGTTATPSKETSKYPPTTRLRKRKETTKRQPKPRVYLRKASEGELSKNPKTSGGFMEMPTI